MEVTALVVAIVSAVAAVGAVLYARRLDRLAARTVAAAGKSAAATEKSAAAVEIALALDRDRRHAELTPRFRVTFRRPPDPELALDLNVHLNGPLELGQLDELIVTILDDDEWRRQGIRRTGLQRDEQLSAAQIWGPYRFLEGIGPGNDPVSGAFGPGRTGRALLVP
jgi:hypothetical protein